MHNVLNFFSLIKLFSWQTFVLSDDEQGIFIFPWLWLVRRWKGECVADTLQCENIKIYKQFVYTEWKLYTYVYKDHRVIEQNCKVYDLGCRGYGFEGLRVLDLKLRSMISGIKPGCLISSSWISSDTVILGWSLPPTGLNTEQKRRCAILNV